MRVLRLAHRWRWAFWLTLALANVLLAWLRIFSWPAAWVLLALLIALVLVEEVERRLDRSVS